MSLPMKKIAVTAALALGLPTAHAQLTDLLRSVTSAVKSSPSAPQPQGSTAVLGVRGMDDEEAMAKGGAGNGGQAALMLDGWAATPAEATKQAGAKGLQKRQVVLRASAAKVGANEPENGK